MFREQILLPLVTGKRVLDVGAVGHDHGMQRKARGGGWLHDDIRSVAAEVTGVDLLKSHVDALNAQGYNFVVGDAEDLPFEAAFDVVNAGEIIEHLSNAGRFLESAHRALVPGGYLVLTTPNAFALSGVVRAALSGNEVVNAEHTCYYSMKTLTHLIGRYGFEIERAEHVGRPARYRAVQWARTAVVGLRAVLGETLVVVARKPV